jgi:hypothetical protein
MQGLPFNITGKVRPLRVSENRLLRAGGSPAAAIALAMDEEDALQRQPARETTPSAEIDAWLEEQQSQYHRCACGCGERIEVQRRHFWAGIPKHRPGHFQAGIAGYWHTLSERGYLTISQVARALGIGETTIRRHEGGLFPKFQRDQRSRRIFTQKDLETMKGILAQRTK